MYNCTIVLLHPPNTPLLHRASLHLERSEIPREDVSKLSVLLFFVILSARLNDAVGQAAKNLINIQVEFLHSVQDDKIQPFETASIQERHHCITASLYHCMTELLHHCVTKSYTFAIEIPETMYGKMKEYLQAELEKIRQDGLYKNERILMTPQGVHIKTTQGLEVLNFCANNYLGLCNEPRVMAAANYAFFKWGFGMASVRFICGTQLVHKQLEEKLSEFLGTEDTILYSSAFDANGGVFEPLLGEDSAIISDELNHASIIDGVRLCKAQRFRYKNNDMADLEAKLKEASGAKFKMIVTDGVFSMDGIIVKLDKICDLADKYDALVLVDDSHATGFIGSRGRGTHEYHNVMDRVDIITTTFGKALGGASGGCISGHKEIIDLLRQRSRPYLFSNSLTPAISGATLEVINLLTESTELRDKLNENTILFRKGIEDAGFKIVSGTHPIVPVLLGHLPNDAKLSQDFANELLKEGIYVIGFYYPVVPKGKSRIRVQISAAHSKENIEFAIEKFTKVGKKLGAI